MNKRDMDVLLTLANRGCSNQRELAHLCGSSLGGINLSVKKLQQDGYITSRLALTKKSKILLKDSTPKRAVILAAGFGMRMVPINTQVPKALLEVKGQTLIERLILQLHEVGIREIRVIVGFMKERLDYLIDDYGVELIFNPDYASKNNLHSLSLVADHLADSYILPCDIWCKNNPFRAQEIYPWYMVTEREKGNSTVRVNRRGELTPVPEEQPGNNMVGIAYIPAKDAPALREQIRLLCQDRIYDGAFWEDALFNSDITVNAMVIPADDVQEIDTYEQLCTLDRDSNNLHSEAISTIVDALHVEAHEITNISVLKKGTTNRSFLFTCRNKKYILRIPGEEDKLINHRNEAAVYHALASKQICDNIAYFDPENGYKITEYLENSRSCDPNNYEDIRACMARLRHFHELNIQVDHDFDIFKTIDYFESLWNGEPSWFRDYQKTKACVFSLKEMIDSIPKQRCLTHIDAVPDNFLFTQNGDIRLIDWEYAGMQDPHVDIAMFCICGQFNAEQIDQVINAYFPEGTDNTLRTKIYCYISACGLLWSNWCEYKRHQGVEFGAYSLKQYRYAKDYYKLVRSMNTNIKEDI